MHLAGGPIADALDAQAPAASGTGLFEARRPQQEVLTRVSKDLIQEIVLTIPELPKPPMKEYTSKHLKRSV